MKMDHCETLQVVARRAGVVFGETTKLFIVLAVVPGVSSVLAGSREAGEDVLRDDMCAVCC